MPTPRILYLAHRAPFPPDKGDRIRGWRHLTRLAQMGQVDLLAMADTEAEAAIARDGLRPLCRAIEVVARRRPAALARVGASLLTGQSLTVAWLQDSRVRRRLAAWQRERDYDLAFAFSSGVGPWLEACAASHRVIDLCDLDALKWRALAADGGLRALVYGLEARRLLPLEQALSERMDLCFLSTPQEAADLTALTQPKNLQVLTNGAPWQDFVDLGPPSSAPPVVAFLGQMDYPPNVLAARHLAEEVMPQVWAQIPDAGLRIIGRAPTAAVQRLAATPRIEVTGAVASVPAALADVRVFCAPLDQGRGIPNKILDALSAGRATVVSSWSAHALSGRPGDDYLIADGSVARAQAIIALLRDPARCDALGAAGQRYVRRAHDWDRVLDQLERWLVELLPQAGAHAPLLQGVG